MTRLSNTLFFPRDEGTVPPDIGKLAKLEILDLRVTNVAGESWQLTLTIRMVDHAGASLLTLCVCMGFCYAVIALLLARYQVTDFGGT